MNITGEENEKEFLEKCYKNWVDIAFSDATERTKLIRTAVIFREMRHRIDELQE